MLRALLIEDEIPARADLLEHLAAHPEVQLVGEAATVAQAQELMERAEYDLVFLDIQLLGGTGFDLVPHLRAGARIIFTTAHDQFAVRAFEVNAVDYLLKPIVPARLAAALSRVAAAPDAPAPDAPGLPLRPSDRVYLSSGQRARFAPVADISIITAEDNYSDVLLAGGERLLVRRSLAAWEQMLPATHFLRVHRTRIVNLARIVRYERDADEHTQLFVQGASGPVSASRRTWAELRDRLAALHPRG